MTSLWKSVYKINPKFFPNGLDFVIPSAARIGQAKFQVTYHVIDKFDSKFSTGSGNFVA